jgi:hypothetical protein
VEIAIIDHNRVNTIEAEGQTPVLVYPYGPVAIQLAFERAFTGMTGVIRDSLNL